MRCLAAPNPAEPCLASQRLALLSFSPATVAEISCLHAAPPLCRTDLAGDREAERDGDGRERPGHAAELPKAHWVDFLGGRAGDPPVNFVRP
jgi:hypothetical protein